jgi:hypothetical protein
MSDSARHAAHYVAETTFGETPASPAFKRIRHVGCTLGVQRGSLQSEELRPDRQISDFRLGTISVAGELATELSFASFDDFLEAVTLGTWTPKATKTASTISVAASDSSFNDSADGLEVAGFEVGDLITASNFDDNNGTFRIASVAAGKITVTLADGSPATLVDEVAASGHKIETTETVLKAGTTRRSFSILRHFTDQTAKPYHLFNGVEFNSLSLAVAANAMVSAKFGVMGREGIAPAETAPSGATFAAATTSAPLDGFTGALTSGGTPVAEVTEFSINLENGLEMRNVVGSKFTRRPSIGRSNLTGSATVYFEDSTFLEKFINEESTSLEIEMPDGDGNSYIFEIPRFKFTGGQPDVSGQGSINLSMPFQGIMDPVSGSNIIIRKIPAA